MLKFVHVLFMVSIAIGFNGCASKNIEKPKEKEVLTKISSKSLDIELDEFADEMEIEEINDPFSGYNRIMTSFNDNAYEYVIKPVAKGYKFLLHEEIRISVQNFFNNLYYPMRFVNNVLQGKFKNSAQETGRFVINTTIGVLGLFDPAKSKFGLEAHEEDFGQTLGFYGVGSGPHIVLPLLGPSNLRDALSLYPDSLLSLIDYNERSYWTLTDTVKRYLIEKTFENINYASLNMQKYDKMKEDSIDLYPYLRYLYEQHRDKQIEE